MGEYLWIAGATIALLIGLPGGAYLAMRWLFRQARANGGRPTPPDSAIPERTVPGGRDDSTESDS
jgi:hypothetical protein